MGRWFNRLVKYRCRSDVTFTSVIITMDLIDLKGKQGAALRTAAKANQKTMEQRVTNLEEEMSSLFWIVGLTAILAILH